MDNTNTISELQALIQLRREISERPEFKANPKLAAQFETLLSRMIIRTA